MPQLPRNSVDPQSPSPQDVLSLLLRGSLLKAEAEASALLRRFPGNLELHFTIGLTLARQHMPRLALPHLQRAASRRPADGDALRTYGAALLDAGELEKARLVLNETVGLNSKDFLAHALLGRLHASIDDRSSAESCFRAAIAFAPTARRAEFEDQLLDLQLSWGNLNAVAANLEPMIENGTATPHQLTSFVRLRLPGEASTAAELVDQRLTLPGLQRESHIELLHAKAILLENSNKFGEAFSTLLAAKSQQPSEHYQDDFEAYVGRMLAMMTRPAISAVSARIGDESFAPIFIAGVPRSGTTLTEQILSAHSQIGGAGEAGYLREVLFLLSRSGASISDSLEATMDLVGFGRIATLRDGIRIALQNRTAGAPVVIEKTPQNFMIIHLILALFPNARIIHCFRDPADNFISAFKLNMGPEHGYTRTPQSYAHFYRCYAQLMRHWHREFPDRIFALDYEGLVTSPEPKIRAVLQFLGLPWEPACLAPQDNVSRVTTPSMFQVRQPINPRSIGSARIYAAHIGDAFLPASAFAPRD